MPPCPARGCRRKARIARGRGWFSRPSRERSDGEHDGWKHAVEGRWGAVPRRPSGRADGAPPARRLSHRPPLAARDRACARRPAHPRASRRAGSRAPADRAAGPAHRGCHPRHRNLCRHLRLRRKVAFLEGKTPFELEPPSREWAQVLHSFSGCAICARREPPSPAPMPAPCGRLDARCGRARAIAADPEVTAHRVIAWLTQAPFILQDADHEFYRRFMRAIARQVRGLRKAASDAPDGYPRLIVIIALAFAGLCMSEQSRLLRAVQKRLSRNWNGRFSPMAAPSPAARRADRAAAGPSAAAPRLRRAQPAAPPALMNAIDRMMPMLRFFRHGDGRSPCSTAWAIRRRTSSPPSSPMTMRAARRWPMPPIQASSGSMPRARW